eukprot:926304-Rhodomonas_salina.4
MLWVSDDIDFKSDTRPSTSDPFRYLQRCGALGFQGFRGSGVQAFGFGASGSGHKKYTQPPLAPGLFLRHASIFRKKGLHFREQQKALPKKNANNNKKDASKRKGAGPFVLGVLVSFEKILGRPRHFWDQLRMLPAISASVPKSGERFRVNSEIWRGVPRHQRNQSGRPPRVSVRAND